MSTQCLDTHTLTHTHTHSKHSKHRHTVILLTNCYFQDTQTLQLIHRANYDHMALSVYCCPRCSNDRPAYDQCFKCAWGRRQAGRKGRSDRREKIKAMRRGKKWGMAENGGRERERERERESSWLLDKLPSSLLFLCYTPALQHSLQELRGCSLFHIPSAASEETNHLHQNVPAQLGTGAHWRQLLSAYVGYLGALIAVVLLSSKSQRGAVLGPDSSFVERTTRKKRREKNRGGRDLLIHWCFEEMRGPGKGLEYPTMHWESKRANPDVLSLPWLIMQLHCDLAQNSARHWSCWVREQ